jgi:hypothetical protein
METICVGTGRPVWQLQVLNMKSLLLPTILVCFCRVAFATQADDTIITIDGHTAGATPFLSQLTLSVSDTTSIKSIQFTITPKPGSATRPLSATYSNSYLTERGNIGTGMIFLLVVTKHRPSCKPKQTVIL